MRKPVSSFMGRVVLALLISSPLVFVNGCAGARADLEGDTTLDKKEESDMSLSDSNVAVDSNIPPIDREVPEKTELATFALG